VSKKGGRVQREGRVAEVEKIFAIMISGMKLKHCETYYLTNKMILSEFKEPGASGITRNGCSCTAS
jgi:hypothetical protein